MIFNKCLLNYQMVINFSCHTPHTALFVTPETDEEVPTMYIEEQLLIVPPITTELAFSFPRFCPTSNCTDPEPDVTLKVISTAFRVSCVALLIWAAKPQNTALLTTTFIVKLVTTTAACTN